MKLIVFLATLTLFISAPASAEEHASEKPVTKALSESLKQAQVAYDNEQYDNVISILSAYNGKDHPVRHLMIGHAQSRLEKWSLAAKAYEHALQMDQEYRSAALALAQAYVQLDDLNKALAVTGKFVNPNSSKHSEVIFYAQTAYRARDLRLATLLTRRAIERFPNDDDLRKLDLAILFSNEEWRGVKESALAQLKKDVVAPQIWKHYAHACRSKDDIQTFLAATEAAWLCNTNDYELLYMYLSSQFTAGHPLTVIDEGKKLLAGGKKNQTVADQKIMTLLIVAADSIENDSLLGNWIKLIPNKRLNREMLICSARSALRINDKHKAKSALITLINMGKADGAVYIWAGALAEELGNKIEAEASYRQAISLNDTTSKIATLHLARLLWMMERVNESVQILKNYLNNNPTDVAAKALLNTIQSSS